MSALRGVLAFALSIAALLAFPESAIASRSALAALPWLALVGWPRGSCGKEGPGVAPEFADADAARGRTGLLALAPLSIGLGLAQAGVTRERVLVALVLLSWIALLAFASTRARRGARRTHALAWTLLVPAPAALALSLALAGADGARVRWTAVASPLAMCARTVVGAEAASAARALDERDPALAADLPTRARELWAGSSDDSDVAGALFGYAPATLGLCALATLAFKRSRRP